MGLEESSPESRKTSSLVRGGGHRLRDSLALTFPGPDHSENEQRYLTVGMSGGKRVLIVAHTDRDDTVRIISARVTTNREGKHYEENQ